MNERQGYRRYGAVDDRGLRRKVPLGRRAGGGAAPGAKRRPGSVPVGGSGRGGSRSSRTMAKRERPSKSSGTSTGKVQETSSWPTQLEEVWLQYYRQIEAKSSRLFYKQLIAEESMGVREAIQDLEYEEREKKEEKQGQTSPKKQQDRWQALADELDDKPATPPTVVPPPTAQMMRAMTEAEIRRMLDAGLVRELTLPTLPPTQSPYFMGDCSLVSVRRARDAMSAGGLSMRQETLYDLLDLCVRLLEQEQLVQETPQPLGKLYLTEININADYANRSYTYGANPGSGTGYITVKMVGDLKTAQLFSGVSDFTAFRAAVMRCV